jgi:(Z)-2-((N-methylformamido)methylene)-5-hydroxybutyrolactone dehydrogenase
MASTALTQYRNFVSGDWIDPASDEWFETINPTTGDAWALLPESTAADVDQAVRAARSAFESPEWAALSATKRGALLRRLGDLVGDHADTLAEIETRDIGKLIRETRAQARAVPEWFYFFAGAADKLRGAVISSADPSIFNYTLREPVGVVAAIVPWNSPLILVATKLAPALAAGNTVVIKPSEHASASVLELARLAHEAGLPPGVINVVTGHAEPSKRLAEHPDVNHVSFTGSTVVGRSVAQAAVGHFATITLELGGKSPQLCFADANIEAATNGILAGIFAAAGQTCVAGSRVLVHEDIYDEVLTRVTARARDIKIGDPLDANTELGPLAFDGQLERVRTHVANALDDGAVLLTGGEQPQRDEPGFFYLPTILTEVSGDMRIAREEVFGPVLSVLKPFSDEAEAIREANNTTFGLAAGVWTENLRRAHRVARSINAGTIWINTYRTLSPLTPTGGFGASGIGKENGLETLLQVTRLKSIWLLTEDERPVDPFRTRV